MYSNSLPVPNVKFTGNVTKHLWYQGLASQVISSGILVTQYNKRYIVSTFEKN